MKVRIRRAKAHELMEIASIVIDAFVDETNKHINNLEKSSECSHEKFYNFYLERAKSNTPFVIYIAELNDKIIGIAGGIVDEHPWSNIIWGSEDFWFVKKEHRGSRAGLLLFNKLMDWFKKNKAERIHMTHYTWNDKVEKFYTKKGFVPFETSYVYKVGD